MSHQFLQLIIIICVLIGAWFVVERFSPDPLVTKLCQIALFVIALIVVITKVCLFVIALIVVITKVLPLAGIG